jgi:restriction endonuclease S subunit
MKKVSIPLPPLNEQQRIVERIEELLPEIQSLKTMKQNLKNCKSLSPKR